MRLPPFYPCLLAILFYAVFASTSSSGKIASLKGKKFCSKIKSVVVRLVTRRKPQGKCDKASVVIAEDKPKSLIELLPKALVEIVIGYFSDEKYSIFVSTHSWLFKTKPAIAVDSARIYVMTYFKGLRCLNHSLANLKDSRRRCIELCGPQRSKYYKFSSSHDGRCISFSCGHEISTEHGMRTKYATKWFTQDSALENGKPRRVAFEGEKSSWGLLSRDGQTLYSYNRMTSATRIYQIKEEAGKRPTVLLKFEHNGKSLAVSGKGNRVMIKREKQFEIYDIGQDASKLVCRIDAFAYIAALNEDGNEAAFVNSAGDKLRIVGVDRIVGDKVDQPAIVTVKVPESLGVIAKLVYSDESKLHVLHPDGKVSLLDPSTKALVSIEAPEEGQTGIAAEISPNADYFATLQCVDKEEGGGKRAYITTVKRKLGRADWRDLFGYEADMSKQVV